MTSILCSAKCCPYKQRPAWVQHSGHTTAHSLHQQYFRSIGVVTEESSRHHHTGRVEPRQQTQLQHRQLSRLQEKWKFGNERHKDTLDFRVWDAQLLIPFLAAFCVSDGRGCTDCYRQSTDLMKIDSQVLVIPTLSLGTKPPKYFVLKGGAPSLTLTAIVGNPPIRVTATWESIFTKTCMEWSFCMGQPKSQCRKFHITSHPSTNSKWGGPSRLSGASNSSLEGTHSM